ncbi:PilZ domain-containing protein [Pseudomonas baetica]|uniref:PilZ domain-containing protein n=1 Tax=Pseudomonas baetica TaxID=674054 RepID=UPI0024073CEB|nr:PilZ domain-containing protein [Pseudomonas baetica]MDF9779229.1 hypothetical protein [Pseudomonas baetica]
MNASNRRHTRYTVPEGALVSQKIRSNGVLARMLGWADCRLRDISIAGALILTEKKFGIGDKISIKLSPRKDAELVFEGEVVNCSKDPRTGHFQLGIAIQSPAARSPEESFINKLESVFHQVA